MFTVGDTRMKVFFFLKPASTVFLKENTECRYMFNNMIKF